MLEIEGIDHISDEMRAVVEPRRTCGERHRGQAPHLSTAAQARSNRSTLSAKRSRFLEWREKQKPKPVRVRYWQSSKPVE
jgi:hypothetical protein